VIRVALPLIDRQRWAGGYNYLLNLLQVLATVAPGEITGVIFAGNDASAADVAELAATPGVEVVRSAHFDTSAAARRLRQALLTGRDATALAAFAAARIDVIFEAAQFHGWRVATPTIAWLPDFQHRYLSHLFSRVAWWRREIGFRAQIAAGRHILLSSEDARADCEHWYPSTRGRTTVLRFAVPRGGASDAPADRAVAAALGLPERYIFMPNQLWVHKNHTLVLKALAPLKAQGVNATIAVTGAASDPRAPGHGAALTAQANMLGVADRFLRLGSIPYAQVGALLRDCTALLNPSRFEGWSTTVEEAKAAGTPMLLSDLRVHHEQAGDQARYFSVDDAAGLAALLASTLADPPSRPDPMVAAAAAAARVTSFATGFVALTQAAVRR